MPNIFSQKRNAPDNEAIGLVLFVLGLFTSCALIAWGIVSLINLIG